MRSALAVLLVFAACAAVAFTIFLVERHVPAVQAVVRVGEHEFRVEIADTPDREARGLSGRASLGEDEGMFFIFAVPGTYGFWMKEMNFPIDIIWIAGGRVAGFVEQAQPEPGKPLPELAVYYPPEDVDRVLEVNAGTVARYGIKAGDAVVRIDKP